MSPAQIGVAIVGAGAVGQRFLALMEAHPAFAVRAVADTDTARSRALARTGRLTTADARAAIASRGVDLVYVAVPPAGHAAVVDIALEHDRALLCEKPLGVDVEESTDLVRRVGSSGVPAAVNFVHATAPAARELAKLVAGQGSARSGQQVERAEIVVELPEWPRHFQRHARWLTTRQEGGPTREIVSHYLFLAARLLGDLTLRHGKVTHPDGPDGVLAEGTVDARFSTACGTDVSLRVRTGATAERTALVLHLSGADEERLVVQDFYDLRRETSSLEESLLRPTEAEPRAAYLAQLDHVVAMLTGRHHTSASFTEALAVQHLVEDVLTRT